MLNDLTDHLLTDLIDLTDRLLIDRLLIDLTEIIHRLHSDKSRLIDRINWLNRLQNWYSPLVFSTLFTLCHFETKNGEYFYFWTVVVFLNWSSNFCLRMVKSESLLVLLAAFYWQNHYHVRLLLKQGRRNYLESSEYLEIISLIWKWPYYDKF